MPFNPNPYIPILPDLNYETKSYENLTIPRPMLDKVKNHASVLPK
jgi:hypothetical protein